MTTTPSPASVRFELTYEEASLVMSTVLAAQNGILTLGNVGGWTPEVHQAVADPARRLSDLYLKLLDACAPLFEEVARGQR